MEGSGGGGRGRWLRNRYWILRHGKSIPNEKGLIVSSMENGILAEYELAAHGVDQARLAGQSFKKILLESNTPRENVIPELRERYFGPSFELKSHDKYEEIWDLDARDPFMQPEGGESVAHVVDRLTKALVSIESEFEECAVLIVSHGDPLQILQTMLKAAEAIEISGEKDDLVSRIEAITVPSVLSKHRNFALLTGELRCAA